MEIVSQPTRPCSSRGKQARKGSSPAPSQPERTPIAKVRETDCAAIPTGLRREAVRTRKGRIHGGDRTEDRPLRAGQRRHLFLDEGGDIPLELQSKFLRVLRRGVRALGSTDIRVDIRLVARPTAISRRWSRIRSSGTILYRLNVFPILNPPLRERGTDIPSLVQYFTQKFATRMNKRITAIPTETMTVLSRYHWPGNIRELENFIERAVILTRGSSLTVPLSELKARRTVAPGEPRNLSTLEDAERQHIRHALQQANWLVGGASGAAAKLGMKRTTLQSKMAKLGIERPAAR